MLILSICLSANVLKTQTKKEDRKKERPFEEKKKKDPKLELELHL